jgi:hypothetical protein
MFTTIFTYYTLAKTIEQIRQNMTGHVTSRYHGLNSSEVGAKIENLGTRLVKTSDCKVLKLLIAIRYGKWIIDCYRYEKMDEPFFASLYK